MTADSSKAGDASASSLSATQKRSLVEIKNGRILFKQKPISFEKMTETMQETVKFREFLRERERGSTVPLDTIPVEFVPLIGKLVHESDKTSITLAKHIQQTLSPDSEDDDSENGSPALSLNAIETCIKSIAVRTNYGVDIANAVRVPPANISVWRWELSSLNLDWLPKASRDKVAARLAERIQAKQQLQELFAALPQAEQDSMLGVKSNSGRGKAQIVDRAASIEPPVMHNIPSSSTPMCADKDADDGGTVADNGSPTRKGGRPKKSVDLEQAAKEQERLERRNVKAEKDRKEKESQAKSRLMMASFFSKSKGSSPLPSPSKDCGASTPSSKSASDFEKTFKPFVLRKDVILAPANAFRAENCRQMKPSSNQAVIVIDDEEPSNDVEILHPPVDIKSYRYQPLPVPGVALSSTVAPSPIDGFRSYHPEPVRNAMTRLSEAEVSGDAPTVVSLLSSLSDRKKYPAKVIIFHEDLRPGYFGTFTRRSRVIGPRTPLARDDVCVDYSYDSGEDWEQEDDAGEDVADASDAEREDEESEDDMDGWLVDDDDDDDEIATPLDERNTFDSPLPPSLDMSRGKRRTEMKEDHKDDSAKSKKRKIVVPLVPFTKGPCWETEIGRCQYEPFKQYRVQFFNDAQCPIDPFTFVSDPVEESRHNAVDPVQMTTQGSSSFVIPALPPHVVSEATGSETKKLKIMPKSTFPDAHIQYLCGKVAQVRTGSLPVLVDAVYQDLRVHKVKKNAIEAKIREICAKDARGSAWAVKAEYTLPMFNIEA